MFSRFTRFRQKLHSVRRWVAGATLPIYGYDGINSDAAPIARTYPNAGFIAGYDDGLYAWSASDWALFPNATHIHIVISAAHNFGDVLDVENGDATPSQTEGWISLRKSAGYLRPTIYCSAAAVAAVRVGTGKWILNQDYDLWVADWKTYPFQYICSDGKPAALTQYNDGSIADYDVCYDPAWPHRSAAPPPPPPSPGQPTLQLGATGAAVVTLQSDLNNENHAGLTADGVFGPLTEAAVKNYQASRGLTVDGVVGPVTWAALDSNKPPLPPPAPAPVPEPILREGATGAAVQTLQRALNAHGFRLAVDGDFGPATLAAVEIFQRDHGLTVDGVVGPVTWSHLGNYSLTARTAAKKYVATGTVSLNQAAYNWGVSVNDIVNATVAHGPVRVTRALLAYLSNGNGPGEVMPAGLIYWCPAH